MFITASVRNLRPSFDLRGLTAALFLVLLMPLAGAAAETAPAKEFNLESQDAASGLRALAVQGDFQVFFPAHLVEGRKINQVRGKFTAVDALEKALRGTGLNYRTAGDGTYVVQKEGAAPAGGTQSVNFTRNEALANSLGYTRVGPDTLRLANAQATETAPARQEVQAEKSATKNDANKDDTVVEVTGSRIRSLLGEQSFTPILTFNRQDIERAGVSTIGELSRLIPQAYSQGSYDGIGFGGQSGGLSVTADGSIASSTSTTRSTFNLRGLGTQNTLVLVNGRRVAKTGVIRGNDANDLAGIPISSIERVDVLTDGASAIYGSDAVGGVINIILRKNYSGTEATATYENTFDTDTAVTTLALSHSFTAGKLSGSLSGSYQDRNAFAAVDRYFTATDDWRTLGGTSAPRSIASSGAGLVLGPGIIRAASGNLPGRSSPYALIPAGADGSLRPASDYVSITTADLPAYTGTWAKYVNIISPQTVRAANLRMNYPVSDRAELFLDSRHSETATAIEGQPVSFRNSMLIPADYAGNPFGVDIRLSKTFWELGELQGHKDAKTSNTSVATGITGLFGGDWRYEASFDWNRGINQDSNAYDPVLDTDVFNLALDSSAPPVLLYDSLTHAPNDADELLTFLRRGNRLDRDVNMGLTVSVDGPVFDLPAGAVRVAVGAERRRETARTSQSVPEASNINLSLLGNFEREIDSAYTEVLVPLVSAGQGVPLINRLALTAAARYDRYADVGSDVSPRYGLTWYPISWVMLRGTRNYAFRAPNLNSLYRPVTESSQAFSIFGTFGIPVPIDHARDDEPLNYDVLTYIGGNLGLKPEKSVSNNIGIVIDLPSRILEGLSVSVDLVDIEYTDRIGGIDTQVILDLFPERITRGAGLPGDPPGMPGRITYIDNRSVNLSRVEIRSTDYQVKYTRSTPVGTFDLRAAATAYDKYDSISLPGAAPVSSSYLYPTRYTLQSYWKRGPLGLGVTGFYQERRFTNTNRTAVYLDDAIEWNLQGAYDFGAAGYHGGSSWVGSLVSDLKLSLTVFNIFDTEPPHVQGNAGFGVTDPRMRRYSLALTKTF